MASFGGKIYFKIKRMIIFRENILNSKWNNICVQNNIFQPNIFAIKIV